MFLITQLTGKETSIFPAHTTNILMKRIYEVYDLLLIQMLTTNKG